jgi:hypothetical protein
MRATTENMWIAKFEHHYDVAACKRCFEDDADVIESIYRNTTFDDIYSIADH